MWVRANDSAFISQFQIYTGKTRDNVEYNLGEKVVTDLTRSLMDNKPMHFVSNFRSPQDVELVSQKLKEESREQFNTIKLITDYNANMGFVDKSDMYKACYEIDRKSKKLAVANELIGADPETPQRDRKSTEKPFKKFKIQVPLEKRLDKSALTAVGKISPTELDGTV
ncbi:hypothetical protein ILUMI_10261 [Ignelater luminosus]|uniref:Uncharacterized protein n=1 Tax=Ignelater luminosus TaxID=2038154 RepID=A0A8K0CY82_IGNLU|nr:hypothetical protein ILUMI_10261 [Ignelater luminosus]